MSVDPSSGDGVESGLYRAAWIFYLLLAIAAVVWIGSGSGLDIRLVIDPHYWWLDILLGVGSGVLLIGLWRQTRRHIASMRELEQYLATMLEPLSRDELIALALISGFSEELLFRGAMQPAWGFAVTTIVFALLHTGPSRFLATWTVFAALAGAIFGGVTYFRGTILAAIIGHILVNGVNLLWIRTRALPTEPLAGVDPQ